MKTDKEQARAAQCSKRVLPCPTLIPRSSSKHLEAPIFLAYLVHLCLSRPALKQSQEAQAPLSRCCTFVLGETLATLAYYVMVEGRIKLHQSRTLKD